MGYVDMNVAKLMAGVDKQIVAIGNKSPTFQIRRWYDGKIMATQRLMDMGTVLPSQFN